jgi:hypothetical protein
MKKSMQAVATLMAAAAAIGSAAPAAHADPLMPAEVKYLNDLRPNLQISNDRATGWGDAQLLDAGYSACHDHAAGISRHGTTSPVIAHWAFRDLCPGVDH